MRFGMMAAAGLLAAASAGMAHGEPESRGRSPIVVQPQTIEPSQVNAKNIGSCETYDPKDPYNLNNGAAANSLHPVGAIYLYVESHQKSYLMELELTDFSVKYVEQPLHGSIKSISRAGAVNDLYIPDAGYAGNDRYVAEVAVKGIKFKVTGFLRPSTDFMSDYNDICRRLGLPGAAWKISAAPVSQPGGG